MCLVFCMWKKLRHNIIIIIIIIQFILYCCTFSLTQGLPAVDSPVRLAILCGAFLFSRPVVRPGADPAVTNQAEVSETVNFRRTGFLTRCFRYSQTNVPLHTPPQFPDLLECRGFFYVLCVYARHTGPRFMSSHPNDMWKSRRLAWRHLKVRWRPQDSNPGFVIHEASVLTTRPRFQCNRKQQLDTTMN
jgi:hypothetical protein